MDIHVLGIPHSVTSRSFLSCPFTQAVYNFLTMMEDDDSIDNVYHYGHPASTLPDYVKNIPVTDDDVLMQSYGYYSGTEEYSNIFKYDINDDAYITFNRRTIPIIRDNVKENDLVLFTFGKGHELIYKALQPLENEIACIEYMIGYYDTMVEYFKVYQSHGHRIHLETVNRTYNDDIKFAHRVISWGPNPDDFEFKYEKEDYFVFLGRIVEGKGVDLCIQLANILGLNLKIAGPGSLSDLEYDVDGLPDNIEILGPIGAHVRRELLKNAKALLAPSTFFESLGWQVIEAMLSGTPVITSDFGGFAETNIDGITGYRCNTFAEFRDAINNVDNIDNKECYQSAYDRYNYDIIKEKYLNYFKFVQNTMNGSGFYEGL